MRYASFVIRFWHKEGDMTAPYLGLRGRIEHVQSGAVVSVNQFSDVTAFIRQCMSATAPSADEDQEHP